MALQCRLCFSIPKGIAGQGVMLKHNLLVSYFTPPANMPQAAWMSPATAVAAGHGHAQLRARGRRGTRPIRLGEGGWNRPVGSFTSIKSSLIGSPAHQIGQHLGVFSACIDAGDHRPRHDHAPAGGRDGTLAVPPTSSGVGYAFSTGINWRRRIGSAVFSETTRR